MALSASAAGTSAVDSDRPPSFFTVYSSGGNESFSAECRSKTAILVTCNFRGLRFKPPSLDKGLEAWPAEWNRLSAEERAKAKDDAFPSPEVGNTVEGLKKKIEDPAVGPKEKLWLQKALSAYQAKDINQLMETIHAREARTCSTFTQTFSLDFQKIGKGKWLSNPGPGGLCQIVKIYELEGEGGLWTLTETRVTAGETKGPLCEGITDELGKPTVWTWRNPKDWELPCDFISHTLK